jgi:hypothetical protein
LLPQVTKLLNKLHSMVEIILILMVILGL